jgi:hypothetical protein
LLSEVLDAPGLRSLFGVGANYQSLDALVNNKELRRRLVEIAKGAG